MPIEAGFQPALSRFLTNGTETGRQRLLMAVLSPREEDCFAWKIRCQCECSLGKAILRVVQKSPLYHQHRLCNLSASAIYIICLEE
jgi:hypothetical protein